MKLTAKNHEIERSIRRILCDFVLNGQAASIHFNALLDDDTDSAVDITLGEAVRHLAANSHEWRASAKEAGAEVPNV